MSYQVLARKWRPRTFAKLVGQEHVLRALINALDSDRLHHAYLFTGTRGVGKTTLGRILAKSLNCETGVSSTPCGECSACREIDEGRFVDLLEVDAASRTKVEDTRELLENVQYAPSRGRYKVYLIDEVHMLSGHSFNALLKTLEEPPPHVKFILATTDPQKLPVTILSRCLQFNLKCLSLEQISDHLVRVLAEERIEADEVALKRLARAAAGSMRDALSLLDQAIAFGAGAVTDGDVRAMLGSLDRGDISGLLQALAASNGQELLNQIDKLARQGLDFNQVLAELIALLHAIAVTQVVPEQPAEDEAVADLAQTLAIEDVQLYYQVGLIGRRDLPMAPDARAGFEMIMLRMLAFQPDGGEPAAASKPGTTTAAARKPVRTQMAKPVMPEQPARSTAEPAPAPAVKSAVEPGPVIEAPPLQPAQPDANLPWSELVQNLSVVGMAKQLAMNAAFGKREDDRITLILPQAHASLASKNWIERLQAALQAYYQSPIQLSVQVGELTAETETPAEQKVRQHEERLQSAAEALEADPNVQALKKTFDASIDPESISYPDAGE